MKDNATTRQSNPLFRRYGSMVELCFAPGVAVGTPIVLLPPVIEGLDPDQAERKNLLNYVDQEKHLAAQNLVDDLRAKLQGASGDGGKSASGHRAATVVAQQLQEFREALKTGNEAMMEENAFYGLTGLFYRLNLDVLKKAFIDEQKKALTQTPKSIKVSRSYRHIWMSAASITSLGQKLWETFGKLASVGKIGFGMLLFAGSTMTTAKGVMDMLQLPGFVEIFGDTFVGAAHESARSTVAITVGLLLSSAILDFKSRLFQGNAETGKIFKGYWFAFKRYPRWVFLACFLTMISIWTNYDGIVLLISKTQDLTTQWARIQEQVNSALGDPMEIERDKPDSLSDLRAALEQKVTVAIRTFKQIPDDEVSGAASSGVAAKGSRFYAKDFIINGGYVPGKNDVSSVYQPPLAKGVQRPSALSGQVDAILRKSGLDLNTSLEAKIKGMYERYAAHLETTRASVTKNMTALGSQMTFKDYSFSELQVMFNLESYHINGEVQKVVGFLEENKTVFVQTAAEMNKLVDAYIGLLTAVDKLGTPANNKYVIDVQFDVPAVDAIDKLKQGKIPMAKKRNLAELKDMLMERGVLMGSLILSLILFIAVFMDLSDPILYSAMVARWGRRDRHFLDENTERFRHWEEAFIPRLRSFFVRPDIMPTLPNLTCPNIQVLHYVFHRFLEDMSPAVQDVSERSWWDSFRFWFMELFLETRIDHVQAYNARQTAIVKYASEAETWAPRLINAIFSGVMDPFTIGVIHFDTLYKRISQGLEKHDSQFTKAVVSYTPVAQEAEVDLADSVPNRGPKTTGTPEEMTPEEHWALRMAAFKVSPVFKLLRGLRFGFYGIFKKNLMGLEVPFPLTRKSWLRAIAVANAQSRDHINALARFAPNIAHLLNVTLPKLNVETLERLEKNLQQIPNVHAVDRALDLSTLREEFVLLEKGLTETLGLSQFKGFQLEEEMVQVIIEQTGIPEIAEVYLHRRADETHLLGRIDQLAAKLNQANRLVTYLVEEQNTFIFTLTKIRTDYVSHIHEILRRFQNSAMIEKALDLPKMMQELLAIETCLLELWEPVDSLSLAEMLAVDGQQSPQISIDAVVTLVPKEGGDGEIIQHVLTLEKRMAAALSKLNDTLPRLLVIDKTIRNVYDLLDQSMVYLNDIFAAEARLQNLSADDEERDQKKITFLENNHFFFRTVRAQLETLRPRMATLIRGPELATAHDEALGRSLERQARKLHQFLKNSKAYLEGKGSGIGLHALSAKMPDKPPLPASEQDLLAASDEFLTNAQLIEIPAEWQSAEMMSEIHRIYLETQEILRDVSLREWDLLKEPLPPQELLAVLHNEQKSIRKSYEEMERVRDALKDMVNNAGDGEPGMKDVSALQEKSQNIRKQLRWVLEMISKPTVVDRRLAASLGVSPEQIVAQRRQADHDVGKGRAPSRREFERTVIHTHIELSAVGRQSVIGRTLDISMRGICFESESVAHGLVGGDEATFTLLSDGGKSAFPCTVQRALAGIIVLVLKPGNEELFAKLIRQEILEHYKEKSSILEIKPSAFPEGHILAGG